jgi:hypothetical protein
MTKSIKELEKELEEARAAEKLKNEDAEIAQLVAAYVGKSYSSSMISQGRRNKWNHAISIDAICREGKDVVCKYKSVTYGKTPYNGAFQVQYTRGTYAETLNSDTYNLSYRMNNLTYRLKEIPTSLFESLFQVGDEVEPIISDAFQGKLELQIEKTIGDAGTQRDFEAAYSACGIELIDLEKYPKLLRTITYARLPGFFEGRYLVKQFAKQALEYQISSNKERMSCVLCSERIYKALQFENKIIEEHILTLNL